MASNYRVALFGLGKIAYAHMHGYLAPENADRIMVVAGADPSEEARRIRSSGHSQWADSATNDGAK